MKPEIFYLNLAELKTEVSIDSYLQISKSNLRYGSFSFVQPFHPYEQGAFQQRGLGHLFSKVQQTLQDCQPYSFIKFEQITKIYSFSFNNKDNFPNNMSFVGDRIWFKRLLRKSESLVIL